MPAPINDDTKQHYVSLRTKLGFNMTQAAKQAGVSRTWAHDFEKGNPWVKGGAQRKALKQDADVPPPLPVDQLSEDGQKALEDFGFFREHFFARKATPWQEEAAYTVEKLLSTEGKEYCVLNCPPGVGKTTTFTHDLVAWLIAKDRRVRILLGHSAGKTAQKYSRRVKLSLERTDPYIDPELDVQANGVMCRTFGRFKPDVQDLWRTEEFVVEQLGSRTVQEKEATVSSAGQDTGFLGGRYDLSVWDDLVTPRNQRTPLSRDQQQEFWVEQAETRCEPGGLVLLVGQRIAANDLFRFALDMGLPTHLLEAGDTRDRKYHHVVFQSHDEDKCEDKHSLDAPYWPEGCLLDPRRAPWFDLASLRENDRQRFETVFQQRDGDPDAVLVQESWIDGGDNADGSMSPGCKDEDRGIAEWPAYLPPPAWTAVTVDPSPTNWWSCIDGAAMIQTPEGEVPMKDIHAGDRVLTREGYRSVLKHASMGEKDTLEVGLSSGRTLTLTPDHRVLTDAGWVEAGELRPGSAVVTPLHSPATGDAAPPLARTPVFEVVAGEGVAGVAVSASGKAGDVGSPSHVLNVRLDSEVFRVDARRSVAEVADFEAVGDVALEPAIGDPMGDPLPGHCNGESGSPVSFGGFGSVPNPATVVADRRSVGEVVVAEFDNPRPGDGAVAASDTTLRPGADGRLAVNAVVHVVSVRHGGRKEVFDLSVDGLPEFTAEGVIVHNCQWWGYEPESKSRVLLDHSREKMQSPGFLDRLRNGSYVGVLNDWVERAQELSMPIDYLIVERNAAQRWMYQYEFFQSFISRWGITLFPHDTTSNKADPEMGVWATLPNAYKFGLVRLPWAPGFGRRASQKLLDEVLKWPESSTEDAVMSQWFLEYNLESLQFRTRRAPSRSVPSWLTGVRRKVNREGSRLVSA